MNLKTVLNYIRNSALALTTSLALAGTAHADVTGSASARTWATPDTYGSQSTIHLDEPISLDAQFNYVPDSNFSSSLGSFELGLFEFGGGYTKNKHEDWAAYMGVRPNGRLENSWGRIGGGIDFIVGLGGMSDRQYEKSVEWAEGLPDEVDVYTNFFRVYTEAGLSPHDRIEFNLRGYAESFVAISPGAAQRYPRALRGVVKFTDPRTTLALSDARAW